MKTTFKIKINEKSIPYPAQTYKFTWLELLEREKKRIYGKKKMYRLSISVSIPILGSLQAANIIELSLSNILKKYEVERKI